MNTVMLARNRFCTHRCVIGLLLLAVALNGCMSLVSRSASVSAPDQNGIITHRGPSFDNRITWIGWLSLGVMTGGGAIAGYTSDRAIRWNGWDRPSEVLPTGNALLGSLAGLTTGLLITYIVGGPPPPVDRDNLTIWLEKLDADILFVRCDTATSGTVTGIRVLPRSAETTFVVRTLDDVRLFASIFPSSPHAVAIIDTASRILPRRDLPSLAEIFAGVPEKAKATARYVRESPSFDSALAAALRYPEHQELAAHRASELGRSLSDAGRYSDAFPGNPLLDSIIQRTVLSISRSSIPEFVERFPNSRFAPDLKRRYVDSSTTTAEAIESGRKFPEYKGEAESHARTLAYSIGDFRAYLSAYPSNAYAAEMVARMNEQLNRPEVLSGSINTSYNEIAPVISPDGKTLFFDRKYYPLNTGGREDPDEIWYSELDSSGVWSTARQIGAPLNRYGSDHIGAVTPDGNMVLLGLAYDESDGLSLSHRTKEGWSYPQTINIRNYYNLSSYIGDYLANDGRTILLSIQRRDSRGGRDIYVSFLGADSTWSEPMNLGSTINTRRDEDAPFLASDGVTLYFSSAGHKGYGDRDILMSRRLDNTWKRWSKPVNLGPTINSSGSEAYFFIPASGDYAYFASNRFSAGDADIVRIGVPELARPRPVVLISGRVLEQGTNKPLEAEIIYETLADGHQIGTARSDPATGEFKIALPSGASYGFRAKAEGYIAVADNLDLTSLAEYREQSRDLYLVPLEVGQTVRMNNLFFDFAKSTLRRESYPELDRMVLIMKANPSMTVAISGHTDNVGSDENNLVLSESRAVAVLDYLVTHAVDRGRVSAHGMGEAQPAGTNDTEQGRQANRRVEFTIITK